MNRTNHARLIVTCLGVLMGWASAAAAAGPPLSDWPPQAGQRVRVTGPGEQSAVGTVQAGSADSLRIALEEGGTLVCAGDGPWQVAYSDGVHSRAGKGAAIGAVVVGLAGLAVGVAFASDDYFNADNGAIAGGLVGGAFAGALVGGMFGGLFHGEDWSSPRAWTPAAPTVSLQTALLRSPLSARPTRMVRVGATLHF